MIRTLSILILLLIGNSIFAQDFKYGKVSKEELKKDKSLIDSNAVAEILTKKVNITFSEKYEVHYEVFVRLKIYDKSKAEEYLYELFNMHKENSLYSFKAITYNLVNDKITESELEKSQKFQVKVNSNIIGYRVSFPNVNNGSVIDYKYLIVSRSFYFPIQYFQYDIPLVYGNLYFEFPEVVFYKGEVKGEAIPSSSNKYTKSWNSQYSASVYEFEYKDVHATIKEPYVINKNNSRTSIKFELSGVYVPGEVYKDISHSWDKVAESLNKHENFGEQILKNKKIDELALSIVKGEKDTLQMAKLLLNYMHDEFKWNDDDGLFTDEGTNKCLTNKVGNVAELNLLLLSLLKSLGIKSFPIGLSTVEHGLINPSFPSLHSFDYVIVGVKANNITNLMDASSKYSSINILPSKCLNNIGYIFKEKTAEEIEIKNSVDSKIYNSVEAEFDESLNIKAKSKLLLGSYYAIKLMESFSNNTKFEKKLEELLSIKLDSFTKSYNKGVIEVKYKYNDKNNIDIIDNKLIFNPLLSFFNEKNPFNVEKRINTIEFGTPYQHINKIRIKIPKGYKIESLPNAKKMIYESSGEFTYNIKSETDFIEVVSNFKILRSQFMPDEFSVLRDLWKFRNECEGQLVVFVKEN